MKRFLRGPAAAAIRCAAWLTAPITGLVARTGVGGDVCLKHGFLPVPIHFYQPIFDHHDVPESVWQRSHDLPGVAFGEHEQLAFLAELGAFGSECTWPRSRQLDGSYYWDNDTFGYASACLLHAILRVRKPLRVVEIGAGMSTLVFRAALRANNDGSLVSIDPNPPPFVSALGGSVTVVDRPVQDVEIQTFTDADFLFVDSSHVARTGGDVNRIYLDILPRLRSGTTIHVHDVYLPFEYPREYAMREQARYFWNEQYVLQAFLALNESFRVDLAGYWAQITHPREFASAFPGFDSAQHRPTSSIYLSRV